jgi:hypothetical protein
MMPADRSLSPADAAVAVRSFPRRFRAVLARPADEEERWDPDEIARRVGPDGSSAADHLLAADGVLALADRALEQARGAEPVVHPAFAELSSASWTDDHTPVPALLDQFEATADRTATRIEGMDSDDWGRELRIADADRTVDVLTVVQDVVGVVSDHLRAAQRTVDAVR